VQHLPRAASHYRWYLPFLPFAVERLDLRQFDFVLSVSHCVAKGVVCDPGTPHVCYCLTPMRYAWDMYKEYFGPGRIHPLMRPLVASAAANLRRWDAGTNHRVEHFVAISRTVAERIRRHYGRQSEIIYPPVETSYFNLGSRAATGEEFYLVVSALVPYKRVDVAIRCYNRLRRRLVIVGTGPQERELKQLAGPTVEFVGWRSQEELRGYYQSCTALIFPGIEDFGIVPLEAQACGTPVIAYRAGGATETIVDGQTGCFFDEQTPEALAGAVAAFDPSRYDPQTLRAHALRFDEAVFAERITGVVDRVLQQHRFRPQGGRR
jgi:glycosyltransferase involved in cell wall biosynthesis